MLFQNGIKRILKALVIAFVMLVSPAFAATYNITYSLDGGTNNVNNPSTYDGNTSINLSDPTKTDNVFIGWYVCTEEVSGVANAETTSLYCTFTNTIPSGTTGDLYLYAKWAPVGSVYTIHYNTNGGVSAGTSSTIFQYYVAGQWIYCQMLGSNNWQRKDGYGYGTYAVLPNDVTKTNCGLTDCGFAGWCAFDSQADAVAANYTCDNPVMGLASWGNSGIRLNVSNRGDLYLYAKWVSPVYNINYYDDNGQSINVSNGLVQYFTFNHNDYSSDFVYARTSVNGDWSGDLNGMELGSPEKSGYKFLGWCAFDSQADAVEANYTCDEPKSELDCGYGSDVIDVSNGRDLYLYAKWAPMYDISYYDDNGQSINVSNSPVQYYVQLSPYYGDTVYTRTSVNGDWNSSDYLQDPEGKSGYGFAGWCAFYSQADAVEHSYTCDNPKSYLALYDNDNVVNVSNGGNLYLYAKWVPISIYNINYNSMGATTEASDNPVQYYVAGTRLYTRTSVNGSWTSGGRGLGEPEQSGFMFAGWCAFNEAQNDPTDAVNNNCYNPVDYLSVYNYSGSLDVSDGGNWYLYAKWASVYDINYYDDSGKAINVSNTPLQYYVTGNNDVRTREDLNDDYWGGNNHLGESEKSGYTFAGWCAFDSQAEAEGDNYTCDDPVVELLVYDYQGGVNVSNGRDLYLYAKWVSPTPVYNIYYDNMGADRDYGSAERPGQYNVVASNVRTRIDSNADWRWYGYVGPQPEKDNSVFRGWCAFDSQADAVEANYTCQQPIEFLYTGSNCSNCLNVSNRGDLYLYAKWGGANTVNCSAGDYAYYNGSDLYCQGGCPANYYCDGLNSNGGSDLSAEDNGMHSCAAYDANKPYSSSYSTSSSACSACPEVDFSGITAPSGYEIGDFDVLSKDLNGNGVNQAGECVAPVLLYNDMVLICSEYMPGTCDPSSMNAGLMSCRYDSSTGGYTNCSSMAGVCDASELMSLMGVMQSGSEGVLNMELSRKGLSQNSVNWNTFFGSNNIANWGSSSSIVTDRTYCSATSVQCSAGEAARFIIDSNNTLLTPDCVPCPNGFYCSNSDTYTFSDSVFVEHDANNDYDIYMAGRTACTGGVATTATGATDASFCASSASPCVPDRDNNGAIISSRVPAGNILGNSDINGATQTPELVTFLNSNNEPYQACANVYVSALDSTALANSQLAEPTATLSEAGLRTVVCKYNTASGKYDLCSPAFTVCDSMYVGMLQLYNTPSQLASALAQAFSEGQSSYITDSMLSRVFNIDTIESANTCSCDTGFEWSESGNTCCPDGYACCLAGTQYNLISGECEQCSGANCPNTYNKSHASCPDASDFSALANPSVPGMVQFGYSLEGSYGTTADECVAMRVYYNDATDLFTQYGNAYYPSQDINDWVDAGASVAFCKYNTGNSATDLCTPKYSLCPEDDVMELMGADDAVGIMQAALGISDPSTIGSNFTESSSSLASASVTNRCEVLCPEVDFSGITAPSGYHIEDFDVLSKDLNGNGVNQAGECVAPVLLYNDMVLICSEYMPGTCDPSSMNAGLMSCRYDSSTGGYTNCSSMAGVCDASELMSLMGVMQSGSEGVLNMELSRKGLSQNSVNWNTFFGSNNIANWGSSSSIVTDRTYCSATSVQCSAGEAARFIIDSNNTLLTPDCVPCPNGFYCSNSDTYTFSDSVFVEHDANNDYDIYMAGRTACTGGVATTATGATDASFCASSASPCVPDRDNNGAIISSRVPAGNILGNSDINGATQTPELVTFLNSNNEPYQACANVYVSALDSTALANSQLAEPTATLSEAGLRTVVCKYNTASGKYDLCSPAFTVCDSMYVGMLQLYNTPSQLASALAQAFSEGQSSYITDSMLSRVFNIDTIESANTCSCDTGFEWSESGNTCCPDGYACCLAGTQYNLISGECEQCSGANCPNTYNKSHASCPDASDFSALANPSVPGMVQFGYSLEGSYGTTADECVAMRVYYNDATDLFTQYGNAYYPSQDINDWVDAGASVAFCKYNTGNSATDLCTPKYSLCPEDDVMELMGADDAVGIMQAALGISDPSTIGSNFTESSSSLASASVTNRCEVDCSLVTNSTGTDDGNGGCGCNSGYEWDTTNKTCDGISVSINWAGVNEAGEAETCTYGGTLSTPTAPELTGYAFAGWTVGRVVANNNNNVQEQDNGEEIGKGE